MIIIRLGSQMSAADPEPPVDTVVRDNRGRLRTRHAHAPANWLLLMDDSAPDDCAEPWRKMADDCGPVTVVWLP